MPLAARALGGQRRSTLRRQGPALERRLPRSPGRSRRGPRLRRGADQIVVEHRSPRCPRRTRVRDRRDRARRRRHEPPQISSATPWSCCAALELPSIAPRSSCAPASRSPRRASASRRSSASETRIARLASSVPGRSRPKRRARWRTLASPSVQRLGRRAAADADSGGLSRRELEVVRLVAVAARIAKSRRSWSSAPAPWTCTCATSCASSTAARESRPRNGRASSGSSPRPRGWARREAQRPWREPRKPRGERLCGVIRVVRDADAVSEAARPAVRYDVVVAGLGGDGKRGRCGARRSRPPRFGARAPLAGVLPCSSHRASRVIRQAYFEDPSYVPLLLEAYTSGAGSRATAGRRC